MLVIRMQRTGRKGHAQFRVVVQDSRRTPTSGKIVANLGHFNPHTKETSLNKEKAQFYLDHGAQPSERVVRLLKSEKVKLPKWISEPTKGERKTRNPEKRRSTRPAEPEAPEEPAEQPAAEPSEKPLEEADTSSEAAQEEPAAEEKPAPDTPEETKATEEESAEPEEPKA